MQTSRPTLTSCFFMLFRSVPHMLCACLSTSPGSPIPMSNFLSFLSGRPLLFSLLCLFMCNFMTVILFCISNLNIVYITLLTKDSWLIYRVNKSQHLRTPTSHLHLHVLPSLYYHGKGIPHCEKYPSFTFFSWTLIYWASHGLYCILDAPHQWDVPLTFRLAHLLTSSLEPVFPLGTDISLSSIL